MSSITRYDQARYDGVLEPCEDGQWVRYEQLDDARTEELNACIAVLCALEDKSGENSDGQTWLMRTTRSDCIAALKARLSRRLQLMRRIIRTDGTVVVLDSARTISQIQALIGASCLSTVCLRHLGVPLHVMLVDDHGYETEMVDHGDNKFELRATKARKPVNAEATQLYRINCAPGTTHQIVGDVVIVPAGDFE